MLYFTLEYNFLMKLGRIVFFAKATDTTCQKLDPNLAAKNDTDITNQNLPSVRPNLLCIFL